MLLAVSALTGYAIAATDGRIGTVTDVLFDDQTWRVRWLVVDTGTWLSDRKVLIHPSAIGRADYDEQALSVKMTQAQVEASPNIIRDQPVSLQMQNQLYAHYGWDPVWGGSGFFDGGLGMMGSPAFAGLADVPPATVPPANEGDPHLRSTTAVTGSHIQATDGGIGHVENMLIDDARWDIRYLIVDTSNWWTGKHVLISPYAVTGITWADHTIQIAVTRKQIVESPPWDPIEMINEVYEKKLHSHYGWRGYGF